MMNERGTHLSGTQARAGRKANVTRYVLGISLVAICMAFAILLFLNR